MTEKQHLLLLLWAGFIYVFLGTIPFMSVKMNYVSWFSVLFIIASYLRLYPKPCFSKAAMWGWLTLLCGALDVISVLACIWLGSRLDRNMAYTFVTDSNTFLAVATGVCAFMFFKNLKIKYNKAINAFAATTFGVLLIHANSDAMRQWLWKDTIDCVGHYNATYMPLYAIGCVLGIFAVCSLIDMVRIRVIERPFFRVWDKRWDKFVARWRKVDNQGIEK